MEKIFKQVPLYRYLSICNEQGIDKTILDCGAGGAQPPLSLFASYGYQTFGIDFSEEQAKKANQYGLENDQILNICVGDMRKLSFLNERFGQVYSYNSVFHMLKSDIEVAIEEMKRVLMPGGIMFVNFLTVKDERCGEGPHLGLNQYEQMDDEPVIHSYYEVDEADQYFKDMKVLLKEERVIERWFEGQWIKQGFVDYIVQK